MRQIKISGGYDDSIIKLVQYVSGYITLPMGILFEFRNGLSRGKACAYTTRASLTGDTIAEYQFMFPGIER